MTLKKQIQVIRNICSQCGSKKTYVRHRRYKYNELEEDWRHDNNSRIICRRCYNKNYRAAHPRDSQEGFHCNNCEDKSWLIECHYGSHHCDQVRALRDKYGYIRTSISGHHRKGQLFPSEWVGGDIYDAKYRRRIYVQVKSILPKPDKCHICKKSALQLSKCYRS